MSESMTIEEIETRFDSEWVLLEDPETDENLIKGGKLLSAGLDWDRVEQMVLARNLSALDLEKVRANMPRRAAA